jgi:hypothetical protein
MFDVHASLSISPAQSGLSVAEFFLELVVYALSATLEEASEVLRSNRNFAELLCQGAARLRTDVAIDSDAGVSLEVANRAARSLAHRPVVLARFVAANVEGLLQCCDVVI